MYAKEITFLLLNSPIQWGGARNVTVQKNMDLQSEQLVLRQPLGAPKQAEHQLLSRSNLFQVVIT